MTPPPTPLQVWTVALIEGLRDARDELSPPAFEALLDIVAAWIAGEYVRLLLLDQRRRDAA